MRTLRVLVATLLLGSLATIALTDDTHAEATTYYVSPAGSDGASGTVVAPFRTLARAITALHPGDTLVVRNGIYRESVKNPSITRGTADRRITVVAAPQEQPLLQGLLWLKGADYWTISGLDVTWADSNLPSEHMVKVSNSIGWRITDAEIWGARSYAAILVAGTAVDWSLDHLYVHDTMTTNSTNQDHLIYVNAVGNGVIEHNVLTNSPNGRGVKIGPSSSSTTPVGNVRVRYNTFANNLGPSNIQLSYGATGNVITRNIFVHPSPRYAAVTTYNLNGTGNIVQDNIGWETQAVIKPAAGVSDGGGNVLLDPVLGVFFLPQNPFATGYGRWAAEPVAAGASTTTTASSSSSSITTTTTSPTSTTTVTTAATTTTAAATTTSVGAPVPTPESTTTTSTVTTPSGGRGRYKRN